jgi:hypothetical protein
VTVLNFRDRHEWHIKDAFSWRAVILVLTSDRACDGVAKHWASVQRQNEGGTALCGVSEVLGSSSIRAMSSKNWMYKNRLIFLQ